MSPQLTSASRPVGRSPKFRDTRITRAETRVPHRVPCRIRALDGSDTPPATIAETVNLSSDGIAVHVGCDVDHGTRVEVLLPHLNGEPACFHGRVVHSRRVLTGTYEIGIAIDEANQPS